MRDIIDIITENNFTAAVRKNSDEQSLRHHWRDPRENPAFKFWFGDSKVVSPEGKPLVCYHGTFSDFEHFAHTKDLGQGGAGNGFNRLGFWFDTDPRTPNWLAGYDENSGPSRGSNVLPVYLKITNPLVVSSEYFHDAAEVIHLSSESKRLYWEWNAAVGDIDKHNLGEKYRAANKKFDNFLQYIKTSRIDGFDQIMKMLPNGGIRAKTIDVEAFRETIVAEGYDGIHISDTLADGASRSYDTTDWWLAFHPHQIKSVFAKNYDSNSPRISESVSEKSFVSFPEYPKIVEEHVLVFIKSLEKMGYTRKLGRNRVAMISPDNRTVIKIPISDRGMIDNSREAKAFKMYQNGNGLVPMAACRIFYANKEIGVPMLMMRFVKEIPRLTNAPYWVNFVDGQQVGYDHKNNLVAYDL
jgi:hypothetical protein